MSNTIAVSPGELTYCAACADVFGALEGRTKRCGCTASQHLPEWTGGDFAAPFEICRYCQASIVRSGSR